MSKNKTHELWLKSIDTAISPAEREQVNLEMNDALATFAALVYHAAYAHLQSQVAELERSTGREESAEKRTQWVRKEAQIVLQNHHDLETLLYRTQEKGGPAGKEMFQEINKAARQLVNVAQLATTRTGQEMDLLGMRAYGRRTIPEDHVPGTTAPRDEEEK